MSIAELALLITTLSGALVALLGVRSNAGRLDHLQKEFDDEHQRRVDLETRQSEARTDIISIGEQLHEARLDNAIIAEGFNQLFAEFRDVTGHKPAVNLERLKHMRTISYITGPLEPLESGPLQVND